MELHAEIAKELNLEATLGVLVTGSFTAKSAWLPGILPYDLIVGINGRKTNNKAELFKVIESARLGEPPDIPVQ